MLKFEVMYRDEVTQIGESIGDGNILITVINPDIPFNIFPEGIVSRSMQETALSDRVFPPERGGAKRLLKSLGLSMYDRRSIVMKTNGVSPDDEYWIRFDDKKHLTWEDVRIPKDDFAEYIQYK